MLLFSRGKQKRAAGQTTHTARQRRSYFVDRLRERDVLRLREAEPRLFERFLRALLRVVRLREEEPLFEEELLREEELLPELLFLEEEEDDFFFGTFAPSRRASERPIAMACLRLVTFLPEPPLRSVPCFLSCIVFSTLSCAFLEYLAMV